MSLSHSIRWYQRRQARHPDLAAWPEFTAFTGTDVLAAGESLTGAARVMGTPTVRVGRRNAIAGAGAGADADAEVAEARSEGGAQAYCAIVVCTVEGVFAPDASLAREVWVDAELDACRPVEGTFRVIGRPVAPAREIFSVRPTPRVGEPRAWLPHDIRAGDLVAFATREPVSLQDLRRRACHPERLDDGRWGGERWT